MTSFDHYQDKISDKIYQLQKRKTELEQLDIDFNNPLSIKIENELKTIVKGIHDLETIAFYIIQQEEINARLLAENAAQAERINVLLQMNQRLYLRANAAQAVAELHKAKWDKHRRDVDEMDRIFQENESEITEALQNNDETLLFKIFKLAA